MTFAEVARDLGYPLPPAGADPPTPPPSPPGRCGPAAGTARRLVRDPRVTGPRLDHRHASRDG